MNKIVIVTGAAQGMGLGIAKHFLEKKNKVIISDNNKEAFI